MNRITETIVASALAYASEEMGIAIRNAAYSPNIKERLDHSCALFDRHARLIAQAEHIPVHLGSLPWGLRRSLAWLAEREIALRPGEQWVVNDPYLAGTHLNDVTVIRPIWSGDELVAYAVNKAHHADVGGAVPGSMPPDARDLFAEGFIAPPMRLVERDAIVASTVELFRSNSRTPHARTGDLRAQIAGNVTGERRVHEAIERYGRATFEAAIERALDTSEVRMRAALRAFDDGEAVSEDVLEDMDGEPSIALRLRLTKTGDAIRLDYTGTAAQVAAPLNAVFGVTLSGIYYALRAVTDATIPMNEGVFRPIDVFVPERTILNPERPAPVSGGNVETSMRNADLVLAALGTLAPDVVPAQSGGSMNNVMMGGVDRGVPWSFYETNGCGMGARPDADGIDAIHAHMTNTLNTPIEAIERDFPLRIVRYEFADESAGAGTYRGGSGLVRSFQLTRGSATLSLLAERHRVRPRGTLGGGDGATGAHTLERSGITSALPAKTTLRLQAGDVVEIRTAGGGGYGPADERAAAAAEADRRNGMFAADRSAAPVPRCTMSVDPRPLTLAEFLTWEQRQSNKHEYANGSVFAMAGATDVHAQIVTNVVAIVRPLLRGTACRVYASDMRVVTYSASRYPDILVTCDERDASDSLAKRHPKLIFEILSPSTASVDTGDKLDEYQTIASLEEYVLIDSRKPSVRVYRRIGEIFETAPAAINGSVALRSLGFELALTDVYEDIDFSRGRGTIDTTGSVS